MASLSYAENRLLIPSRFGPLMLFWENTASGVRVMRIALPELGNTAPASPTFHESLPAPIARLEEQLRAFLAGEEVHFNLSLLALDRCGEFQRRVLLADAAIPRGRVSTYGSIAAYLGLPQAGRAVGNALAHNPFPLVIPCHRVVRGDGTLGGYQGGLAIKRALLEAEGVQVGDDHRVAPRYVWRVAETLVLS